MRGCFYQKVKEFSFDISGNSATSVCYDVNKFFHKFSKEPLFFLFYMMFFDNIQQFDFFYLIETHTIVNSARQFQEYLKKILVKTQHKSTWWWMKNRCQNGDQLSNEVTNRRKIKGDIHNRRLIKGWRLLYENYSELSNLRAKLGGFV